VASSNRESTRVRWRLEAVALGMHYGLDDDTVREAPLASVDMDGLDRITRGRRCIQGI